MKFVQFDRSVLTPPTLVGMALPLVGMPTWYLIAGTARLQSMERTTRAMISSLVTVGLALGVIMVVLWWEKKPLSSMGIHPQTRRKIIFALSASIIIAVSSTLISLLLIRVLALPMPTLLTETITVFPVGVGIWIVVSSSIAEEILYRGFLIERLGALTGNIWLGGLLTLVWFLALHIPLGVVYILTIGLPASTMITVLYIWRRDLIATMIVHFVFNAPILAAAILFAMAGA